MAITERGVDCGRAVNAIAAAVKNAAATVMALAIFQSRDIGPLLRITLDGRARDL